MLKLYIEPGDTNTCAMGIINLMPHEKTSLEECHYIVSTKIPYGYINIPLIQDTLNSYKDSSKKVLIFLLSDFNEPLNVPENVLFFRAGMYKSHRKSNEYLIPHIWTEDGMTNVPFNPLPKRIIHPTVGFCGTLTSHPCRIQHLNRLNMAPDIKKKFIIRSDYWAGKPYDKEVVSDFVKNIQETHFTLSIVLVFWTAFLIKVFNERSRHTSAQFFILGKKILPPSLHFNLKRASEKLLNS